MTPSSNELAIRVAGLRCGYGRKEVLGPVDLECRPGTITVVVGPNGSGKSTLLRTLVGTIPPLAGNVWLVDRELQSLSDRDIARRVSFVPQHDEPRFGFTARQIVAMGRLPHGKGLFETDQDWTEVDAAMRAFDCAHVAHRPLAELSGGERQRVLIARAVAQAAPVMILDEPTSHLDPAHHLELGELARRLAKSGHTLVMALHDLNLTAMIADRVTVLCEGEVLTQGAAPDVLKSQALDDAFGVRFKRLEQPGEPLRLFAERRA